MMWTNFKNEFYNIFQRDDNNALERIRSARIVKLRDLRISLDIVEDKVGLINGWQSVQKSAMNSLDCYKV